MSLDKRAVLTAFQKSIRADLDAAVASQKQAHEDATHEEARPENDKDTRATESSYLARGLARRVADLQFASNAFKTLPFKDLKAVALGALLSIEDEDESVAHYFVGPAAGGHAIEHEGVSIKVITPESPLGKAVLGKSPDDEVSFRSPKGVRELYIASVS